MIRGVGQSFPSKLYEWRNHHYIFYFLTILYEINVLFIKMISIEIKERLHHILIFMSYLLFIQCILTFLA